MARRRNREINIFNMSLLDILCGALGTFCFMMIALLPYYKPPGKEKDIRESQQKTEALIKKIDETNLKMGDSPAVEDLRDLVEQLKKQIQEMQGQLNQTLSAVEQLARKNQELITQNAELADENEQLTGKLKKMTTSDALAEMQKLLEQLQQQLNQALAENQPLKDAVARLTQEIQDLAQIVDNRTPVSIVLRFDATQNVDMGLEETSRGKAGKTFDPERSRSAPLSPGDVYFYANGYAVYTLPESPPDAEYRVFVNLVTPPQTRVDTAVNASIFHGNWPDLILPKVYLTPARRWNLYGTIKKQKYGELIFTPATTAERNALWTERTGQPVPKPTYTPPPRPTRSTATPEPTATGNTSSDPVLWKKPPPTLDAQPSGTP